MTAPSPLDEWLKGHATTDYEAARMCEAVYWLLGQLEQTPCVQFGDNDYCRGFHKGIESMMDHARTLCGKGEE